VLIKNFHPKRLEKDLPEICQIRLTKDSLKYDLPKTHQTFTKMINQRFTKIGFTKDLPNVYQKDLPKIYQRFTKDLPKIY